MKSQNKIIFIIGNGRSGTHMIADLLNSCGVLEYNGEEEPAFSYSCNYNILKKTDYFSPLIGFYLKKNNYIDKCHTNLWCAETLQGFFPNAIFVACKRNKNDVISSMLKHGGCMSWFTHYDIKFPNKFLGIESKEELGSLTDFERCEKRWIAHDNAIKNLQIKNLFIFDYEKRFSEAERLEDYFRLKLNKKIIK